MRLSALATGEIGLAIGTHALIQTEVAFQRLGFIIIDEQHRFGVAQRQKLHQKSQLTGGEHAHQLFMTATPIPRTLAMTAYTDLDSSIIDALPPGRIPITTLALASHQRAKVIERIANAINSGRQAYWVCTLIDASDNVAQQAAEKTQQNNSHSS